MTFFWKQLLPTNHVKFWWDLKTKFAQILHPIVQQTQLFFYAFCPDLFSTSVELESENVCQSVCYHKTSKIVRFSWNFAHLILGSNPGVFFFHLGHAWRLQKLSDFAEILHTWSYGQSLGEFFSGLPGVLILLILLLFQDFQKSVLIYLLFSYFVLIVLIFEDF